MSTQGPESFKLPEIPDVEDLDTEKMQSELKEIQLESLREAEADIEKLEKVLDKHEKTGEGIYDLVVDEFGEGPNNYAGLDLDELEKVKEALKKFLEDQMGISSVVRNLDNDPGNNGISFKTIFDAGKSKAFRGRINDSELFDALAKLSATFGARSLARYGLGSALPALGAASVGFGGAVVGGGVGAIGGSVAAYAGYFYELKARTHEKKKRKTVKKVEKEVKKGAQDDFWVAAGKKISEFEERINEIEAERKKLELELEAGNKISGFLKKIKNEKLKAEKENLEDCNRYLKAELNTEGSDIEKKVEYLISGFKERGSYDGDDDDSIRERLFPKDENKGQDDVRERVKSLQNTLTKKEEDRKEKLRQGLNRRIMRGAIAGAVIGSGAALFGDHVTGALSNVPGLGRVSDVVNWVTGGEEPDPHGESPAEMEGPEIPDEDLEDGKKKESPEPDQETIEGDDSSEESLAETGEPEEPEVSDEVLTDESDSEKAESPFAVETDEVSEKERFNRWRRMLKAEMEGSEIPDEDLEDGKGRQDPEPDQETTEDGYPRVEVQADPETPDGAPAETSDEGQEAGEKEVAKTDQETIENDDSSEESSAETGEPEETETVRDPLESLPSEIKLGDGDNPWQLVENELEEILSRTPDASEVYQATKAVAEASNVSVPEWDIAGEFDHRALPEGFTLNIDENVREEFKNIAESAGVEFPEEGDLSEPEDGPEKPDQDISEEGEDESIEDRFDEVASEGLVTEEGEEKFAGLFREYFELDWGEETLKGGRGVEKIAEALEEGEVRIGSLEDGDGYIGFMGKLATRFSLDDHDFLNHRMNTLNELINPANGEDVDFEALKQYIKIDLETIEGNFLFSDSSFGDFSPDDGVGAESSDPEIEGEESSDEKKEDESLGSEFSEEIEIGEPEIEEPDQEIIENDDSSEESSAETGEPEEPEVSDEVLTDESDSEKAESPFAVETDEVSEKERFNRWRRMLKAEMEGSEIPDEDLEDGKGRQDPEPDQETTEDGYPRVEVQADPETPDEAPTEDVQGSPEMEFSEEAVKGHIANVIKDLESAPEDLQVEELWDGEAGKKALEQTSVGDVLNEGFSGSEDLSRENQEILGYLKDFFEQVNEKNDISEQDKGKRVWEYFRDQYQSNKK